MAEGRLYLTAADHLNHYPYKVRVPYYVVGQQRVFMEQDIQPIYRPDDAGVMVDTTASIHQMLMWYETKTACTVVEDVQALEIFHRIDAYLVSVEDKLYQFLPDYTDYARRLLIFRQAYYRVIFLRVLNNNPSYKKAYLGDGGDMEALVAKHSFFGGLFSSGMTAIDRLEKPPVEIPAPQAPKEKAKKDTADIAGGDFYAPDENTASDYSGFR